MGKVSERHIISFTVEFVNKVCEVNKGLIVDDELGDCMYWGKKRMWLSWVSEDELTVDEILKYAVSTEKDVKEFRNNDECISYMTCDGPLYDKLYGFDGWQRDVFGDGNEAEILHRALFRISEKYGMSFDWGYGALIFYDVGEICKKLLK